MFTILKKSMILILLLVVSACSNTISSLDPNQTGSDHVYLISKQVATRIMFAAMKIEIDEKNIKVLTSPLVGYEGSVQWGVDKDKITLLAKSMKGMKGGVEVEGYAFFATHSGTAPAAGEPTIERLIDRVAKDAELLGQKAELLK
ncbi:hypothetical protein ESZ36_11340 [Colwellia demingiae]|uniref:DUF4410 domain-containing protein n=1 Tax=Colwellia demingiae TaxID=89401 RepID=A0A5C6QGE0_9GAMM|nr:hypothetical protein [Colwellia demingiae]TWX67878.1 hypothetical protein ESZ36_11340 [Colwellia demingiae]